MSQTRRPNGRSTIYYSEADGYWHGRVTMGIKDDGSPDRRHRKGRTEAEVTKKVRALERKRDAAQVDKPGRAPTVEQWMTTYLETIAPRGLAPRSLDDYWSKTKNWILPCIGKHRLDRLQPEHLDKLYAKMNAAGKADSHVLKVHRILSRALEVAHRRGKVGRNVAKLIDSPSASETEVNPLTGTEARAILEAATERRNGARWSVGLALGLRQGEALGLRWSYVDLETKQVRIWWQLQRVPWRHGCEDPSTCGTGYKQAARARMCPQRRGGGLILREPKGKSKRVIPLPSELVPILEAQREAQEHEREMAGDLWQEGDFVFSQPDGRPVDPRQDYTEWKELLGIAGVRHARVHDGRHTAGTLLIEQGVHPRTVQEILGHSDLRLVQRYTHVASPLVQEATQRMGTVLWGN